MKVKKFKIVKGSDATTDNLEQAVEIDKIVYKDDLQGILENCITWFEKNPTIYTFMIDEDTGKTVGYINAMPITEKLHDAIMGQEVLDALISADDILTYELGQEYILYFCSIVVHPDYHGTKAFTLLYDAFAKEMLELAEKGIFIKKVIAEGVTAKGSRICRLSGLDAITETEAGTTLYSIDLPEGRFLPLSSTAERLRELYQKSTE